MEEKDIKIKKEEQSTFKTGIKQKIVFAKLNKYFLLPFLAPIFCMMSNYFFNKVYYSKIKRVEFLVMIYAELSYVIAGLLHFTTKYRSKSKKGEIINEKNDNSNNKVIELIYNKSFIINTKKALIFIFMISLIYTILIFLNIFNKGKNIIQKRLFYMFFVPLFSKYILKENIYKHQYLSLFICLIGSILIIIPVCLKITKDDILHNILNFIGGIIYPLFLILIKHLSNIYYISPLNTSFLLGIISIIVTCFCYVIYSLIEYHDLSYFNDCFDFSEVDNKVNVSIYIILNFLFSTTLNALAMLVLLYFSPILLMITDIISPMLYWIVQTIEEGSSMPDDILNPIGYIIILFSTLTYNEIIILNFCDLNKNTKKFVKQRQNVESVELSEYINNIRQNSLFSNDDNDEAIIYDE